MPSHYCGGCTHVVFEEDAACPDCGDGRPAGGWTTIQDGFDRWLGRVFDGRYVVTRLIGQGAMGAVYRASSLAISREFAIKVINFKEGAAGIDAPQIRARLHREIDAIGRLRNPHVVPFYEVIELYDAFVGVVMDFIAGTTLEKLVELEGPLSFARAAAILRQIANGVHEAHEAEMIHRDLKPDNVMVERLPAGDDFAHILDFGIVRLDDGVSMTKGFLGTPLYASPEQAMAGEVDRRSDIYSLGAVFYFMLTGRPPFVSDNVYEILQAHVRRPLPRLAEANPSRHYPEELERLVEEMLAKSPTRRPDTLAEVIDRLDDMRRSGVLDETEVPDSVEFELFDSPGRYTAQTAGYKTDPEGLDGSSSSVFSSEEHDEMGPKAAIFHRGPSRGTVKRLIDEERDAAPAEFDRVLEGNTGAHTLGINVAGRALLAATAANGDVVAHDEMGALTLVRAGEGETLQTVPEIEALGLNLTSVCAGTRDGSVFALSADAPRKLFQSPAHDAVTALALDDHDRVWLAATSGGSLYKCTPSAASDVWLRLQEGPSISALAIGPRGDVFAVARKHGEIEVCAVANPTKPYARFSVSAPARAVAFSPDGHLIALVLEDETIAVHLVEGGGRRVHSVRDVRNKILALRFTGQELLGYFEHDEMLCVRYLDRELAEQP